MTLQGRGRACSSWDAFLISSFERGSEISRGSWLGGFSDINSFVEGDWSSGEDNPPEAQGEPDGRAVRGGFLEEVTADTHLREGGRMAPGHAVMMQQVEGREHAQALL